MARSVGIDLGTTNSCVAVLEGVEPTVIPNRSEQHTSELQSHSERSYAVFSLTKKHT